MKETGSVIKVKGKTATVRFSRKSACENCGMCAFKKNEMFVKVKLPNVLHAQVGDEVAVEMGTGFVLTAAMIVYIIPLLAMAIGIFAFEPFGMTIQISLAVAFLLIGFIIAALLDRFVIRKKKGMKPQMVEIINASSLKEEQNNE